jgi:hypothetical protein
MTEFGLDPEFILVMRNDGVHFKEVYGVSWQLQQELLNTVHPTPEAAEEAATGRDSSQEISTQHAVGICTHFDNVISFGGGARRHITDFRKHENHRHYTVTRHQLYVSGAGWITTERFYYSASRGFCGCG